MKEILKRSDIRSMNLQTDNNIKISSSDIDISLNIRGASYIKNVKKSTLTLVANITVVIDYSVDETRTNSIHSYSRNDSMRDLNNDANNLAAWIARARKIY